MLKAGDEDDELHVPVTFPWVCMARQGEGRGKDIYATGVQINKKLVKIENCTYTEPSLLHSRGKHSEQKNSLCHSCLKW